MSQAISESVRFIPTCVGNRSEIADHRKMPSVHPHMRGEQSLSTGWRLRTAGSSPHAWGTGRPKPKIQTASRFIPTCVGNRRANSRRGSGSPVHPHMRGEQDFEAAFAVALVGSSPHAWGTAPAAVAAQPRLRFIPTCVGNR